MKSLNQCLRHSLLSLALLAGTSVAYAQTPPTIKASAKATADQVLSTAQQSQGEIGYDISGVEWLEGELHANAYKNNIKEDVIIRYGAFLGECIINTYKGEWLPDGLIRLKNNVVVDPVASVRNSIKPSTDYSVMDIFLSVAHF